ncbi:MAG TPA: carbonic anhydrase [Miltoncostaeales bacterium]|nr:carbonic anhydrase [Miltoncostaeales bacterium]
MIDDLRTPRRALERLIDGNGRFTSDAATVGDVTHHRRLQIAREQRPFATLVGCSDSRVGPEQLFGSGLGELFIVRNAGNTVGDHALGSIEYSVAMLGVPLVVVLGHERCGAVLAALDMLQHGTVSPGAIGSLVDAIIPAIAPVVDDVADADQLVANAVRANIRATVAQLRSSPEPIIQQPRSDGELWIVGAYYDLTSGHVDFFDLEHDG